MHSVELERKLRLPDPSKAMEGVWKLLKRTRQQLNSTAGKTAVMSGSSGATLAVKRQAEIQAEGQKGRGAQNFLRNTMR